MAREQDQETGTNRPPASELDSGDEELGAVRQESGDPLLKRLVDLAHLGWEADLVILSNGSWFQGRLISGSEYRAALAESIRGRRGGSGLYDELDLIVAAAIDAEDPPAPDIGPPEPRFIHLAGVRALGGPRVITPFLRLRLPAVSGFWVIASPSRRRP